MPHDLTYMLRVDKILAECKRRHWSQSTLATRAGIDPKTITNVLKKKHPASLKTLRGIARALNVKDDDLVVGRPETQLTVQLPKEERVTISLKIFGTHVRQPNDPDVQRALRDTQQVFEECGINVLSIESEIIHPAPTEFDMDAGARLLVRCYGKLIDGDDWWAYVAVKPSKFTKFQLAQKFKTLDMQRFDEFGEVIVSDRGTDTPVEITHKVATMYKIDPSLVIQHMHGSGDDGGILVMQNDKGEYRVRF